MLDMCEQCRPAYKRAQVKAHRQSNKARRKAARYNNPAMRCEIIIEEDVFCSDLWMCGICGGRVDHRLPAGHPLSAEMDHIKPASRFGTHTRDNVQCSHRQCNIFKSDDDLATTQEAIMAMKRSGAWDARRDAAVDKWKRRQIKLPAKVGA
jgi:hypothetical protein